MKTIDITDRIITVEGHTLQATWSDEATEDLKKYHGVDISNEIALALLQEIDFEMAAMGNPLTEEERGHFKIKLIENLQ